MPILFSAVADKQVVLAKFASCEGNFSEIADQVLIKLPSGNDKVTYFHGHYLIHYIVEDQRLYFCITDKKCQRSRAFLFLNQIRRRIISERRARLTQLLADEMYRYSEDYSTIAIREGELDELNRIGVRSSEEILGEKLLLVKNTENLNFSVISYARKTSGEVSIHSNCHESLFDQEFYNINDGRAIDMSVSTYNSEICIIEKCKANFKLVIAIFLIGLYLIYVFDFMPFGHVVVLVMFIIFVLLK